MKKRSLALLLSVIMLLIPLFDAFAIEEPVEFQELKVVNKIDSRGQRIFSIQDKENREKIKFILSDNKMEAYQGQRLLKAIDSNRMGEVIKTSEASKASKASNHAWGPWIFYRNVSGNKHFDALLYYNVVAKLLGYIFNAQAAFFDLAAIIVSNTYSNVYYKGYEYVRIDQNNPLIQEYEPTLNLYSNSNFTGYLGKETSDTYIIDFTRALEIVNE